MKKRLKILNLIDIPWYSGLTDYALAQAEVLSEYGNEIIFACGKNSHAWLKASKKGWETLIIPDRKKLFTPLNLISLKKIADKKDIDVLNAHTGRMQTVAYLLSFLSTKRLQIIRTKSDARGVRKSLTYSRVGGVIAGSEYLKKMFLRAGLENKKVKAVYNAPHQTTYVPPPDERPFRIGILGRLDPVKGHRHFIAAAVKTLKAGLDTEFLIAGKEENVKWSELRKAVPAEFSERIKYIGFADDPASFINSCHLGVIASTGSEAVSRVAMEWMNAGRPLISTDAGSLPEFVEKDLIVPVGSPDLLAEKIISNLDAEKLKAEGLKNLERMRKKFSFENFRKDTLAAFQEFLR